VLGHLLHSVLNCAFIFILYSACVTIVNTISIPFNIWTELLADSFGFKNALSFWTGINFWNMD
jgi:hypothetical protein